MCGVGVSVAIPCMCRVTICGIRDEFIGDGVQGEWGLYNKLGIECWYGVSL